MVRISTEEFNAWQKGVKIKEVRHRQHHEARITAQIITYLKDILKAYCGKTKTMGVFREEDGKKFYCNDRNLMIGKADIECFWRKVMYAIEVKAPGNDQTEAQRVYEKFFHKPPWRIYLVARKVEDVSRVIR
ncbi:MAG: hypothetical protein ABIA66_00910 [Candidatus Omnitrophota bacterium]